MCSSTNGAVTSETGQSLQRQIANQVTELQIGIDQVATVGRNIGLAIDDQRRREASQLANVVDLLCERLIKIAEKIEIDSRHIPDITEGE